MAQSAAQQRRLHPLPAYSFRVGVGAAVIGCSEVSGLKVGQETTTYRHGLSAFEGEEILRFAPARYILLTLKKGVVIGTTALLDWLNAPPAPRPMEISLCDASGVPAVTWRIAKALPVRLEAPSFSAASNEAAIETLEVMAAGIRLEHLG
jgi:phage tail-like protein